MDPTLTKSYVTSCIESFILSVFAIICIAFEPSGPKSECNCICALEEILKRQFVRFRFACLNLCSALVVGSFLYSSRLFFALLAISLINSKLYLYGKLLMSVLQA